MSSIRLASIFLLTLVGFLPLAQARYPSRFSPLCDERLVVIRPGELVSEDGKPVQLLTEPGAVFGDKAAPVRGPLTARFEVRFAGDYTLWIRAGGVNGIQHPLMAELRREDASLLSAPFNDGPGSVQRGGPKAYETYLRRAVKDAPAGTAVADAGVAAEYDLNALAETKQEATETAPEPFEAFTAAVQDSSGERWISVHRVDARTKAGFAWWRIGSAKLSPGHYDLRIVPAKPLTGAAMPLVDAAFLTTYGKLIYPFAADICAPRASYLRFRMDQLPESGVVISTSVTTHALINSTPTVYLNPLGMDEKVGSPHTKPGSSVWYCLQDIERAPGLDFGEVQVQIGLAVPKGTTKPLKGVTQFAMYPFADQIVREFDWNEPCGRSLGIVMDFERWREYLKTFRDCAREHYEMALENADGRLLPLTRPGLYFGSDAGATPDMQDYIAKTVRLFGLNIAGGYCSTIECRDRYGWASFAGAPRMEWNMPFTDDEAAVRKYEEYYAFLKKNPDFYKGNPIWQMTDEPGEGLRSEMTSPLWRYEPAGDEPRWVDYPGYAGLHTRKTDYRDCVFEGKIAALGGNIRILVAMDNAEKPTRYAYWRFGHILPYPTSPENLEGWTEGLGGDRLIRYDPKATLSKDLTPFKVVYEGGRAALFLNGNLLHEHTGLPAQGGFGFDEGCKAVAALRIRPIGRKEHLNKPEAGTEAKLEAGTEAPAAEDDEVADVLEKPDEKETPEWAKPKPLEQFVREDWLVTGGFPEAHEGFRKWAAGKGLTPDFFGKKDWKEVSPLTLDNLVQTRDDARLFYWSRQYSAWLTPKMFSLAAEAIRRASPNKSVLSFVGLSGGYLNVFDCTVLDMFELASYSNGLMPGISDWHWYGAESEQVDAYSAAIFNAGARRYGQPPASGSMIHVVHPSPLRSYACLANAVKYLSYYTFGPYVLGVAGDPWSHRLGCYAGCGPLDNRAAQIDDLLIPAVPRPSRVALLWSQANDHWNQKSSFVDKRTTFLGLSHEYFQPELVTEAQVLNGALDHYDAFYVLEPYVVADVQKRIARWVEVGGLLWTCADALTRNEFNEPEDLLEQVCGLKRAFPKPEAAGKTPQPPILSPVKGETDFRPHSVVTNGMPEKVECAQARIRARYDDGRPAWLEWTRGKGRIIYLAHRAGETYASRVILSNPRIWPDTGRSTLTLPLHEAGVRRDLALSEPLIMANALDSEGGTVVVLFNMRPTPRQNVRVSLKEPAKPYSVETYDSLSLKPIAHEFKDGRVELELPSLDGGQMIVLRRRPAPPDDRPEQEKGRTERLLASKEPLDLAAGAWFAGLHPEWNLADRIVPLLQHERWEVRRSAAESLGRLGHVAAANEIAAALAKETDSHAKGDQTVALARLGHPATSELCLKLLSEADIFVKRQAALAAIVFLCPNQSERAQSITSTTCQRVPQLLEGVEPKGEALEFARKVMELALAEPDVRVRQLGIALLFRLDPVRGLEEAVSVFSNPRPADEPSLPFWAKSLAHNELAFAAYLDRGLPGGISLLLAIAKERRDSSLAAALGPHLDTISAANALAWVEALICQRDPRLSREVFARREKLAPIASSIPAILEYTFAARLGNDLSHWQDWLAQHPEVSD